MTEGYTGRRERQDANQPDGRQRCVEMQRLVIELTMMQGWPSCWQRAQRGVVGLIPAAGGTQVCAGLRPR